jgi:hypothetical protein
MGDRNLFSSLLSSQDQIQYWSNLQSQDEAKEKGFVFIYSFVDPRSGGLLFAHLRDTLSMLPLFILTPLEINQYTSISKIQMNDISPNFPQFF